MKIGFGAATLVGAVAWAGIATANEDAFVRGAPQIQGQAEGRHYDLKAGIEVYFGGIDVLHFDWHTTRIGNSYKAESHVYPVGIAAAFFDIDVTSKATGSFNGPQVLPHYYKGDVVEDDELARSMAIDFAPEGPTAITRVGGEPLMPDEEMLAEVQGMIDPLSAALFNETFTRGGSPCSGTTHIFTGDSAFSLTFEAVEETQLKSSRYNIYDGPALECEVTVSPTRAFDAAEQERMEEDPTRKEERKARLYVGTVTAPDGGADLMLPVKVMVKTGFGNVIAHLVSVEAAKPEVAAPVKTADAH